MPAWQIFDDFKTNTMNGTVPIDFNGDVIKVALWDNAGGAPDLSADAVLANLPGAEVTGTGYSAGGETIGTLDVSESGGTVTFDGDDVSWAQNGGGFTDARYAILYEDGGNVLVAYMDMAIDKGNVTGALTLEFAGTGIFTLSG